MSDSRAFRFCRDEKHAHLQFQPYDKTRRLPWRSRVAYEEYCNHWVALEEQSNVAFRMADTLTSGESELDLDNLSAICRTLPALDSSYFFESRPRKEGVIGRFLAPPGEEDKGLVAAAVFGSIARRFLLAGNRTHVFVGEPGELICFSDSSARGREYKSYWSFQNSTEGRYFSYSYLYLCIPFVPSLYKLWTKKHGYVLDGGYGPFIELHRYGSTWLGLEHNWAEGGTGVDSSWSDDSMTDIENIHNTFIGEVQMAFSDLDIEMGPASDGLNDMIL